MFFGPNDLLDPNIFWQTFWSLHFEQKNFWTTRTSRHLSLEGLDLRIYFFELHLFFNQDPTQMTTEISSVALPAELVECYIFILVQKFITSPRGERRRRLSTSAGNIHPVDICPWQQYLSSYWPNFDQSFWPTFFWPKIFSDPNHF